MRFLDLTLATPAANLACDESLLDWRDDDGPDDILRVWESREHFVVLGYANPIRQSVHEEACRTRGISVLRRCSGGGTVLQGPGSLNFSLIVRHDGGGPFGGIAAATRHVLSRHQTLLQSLLREPVALHGPSDLAIARRKVSGNAQRRKRRTTLFHGTFLLGLDVALVEAVLPMPSLRPPYRAQRPHADFLTNLPVLRPVLVDALRTAWQAVAPLEDVPVSAMDRLVATRYATAAWTHRC